jgi:hypothetical protein
MFSRGSFVVAFGLLGLALAGCESELRGTPGQLNTLRFEYSTAVGVCPGCAVDREVLSGSLLDIDVLGLPTKTKFAVRSSSPDVAEFETTTRCRYFGEENCRDGIAVIAKLAGDADLEVYDDWTGTVLDRVTIKVRDAASLETSVKAAPSSLAGTKSDLTPNAQGIFEVKVDSDVEIVSIARSANGSELIATNAAIHGAYADEQVVGPRSAVADFSATEHAKAKNPGETTVAIVGGTARRELSFRVVP